MNQKRPKNYFLVISKLTSVVQIEFKADANIPTYVVEGF